MHRSSIVVALMLLLAGCGSAPHAALLPSAAVEGQDWALSAFPGHALDAQAGSPAAVLRLVGGRVSGRGPCNTLGADYALDKATLHISALTTSKRYCAAQSTLEAAFFDALRGVDQATIEDGDLLLSGSAGSLRFTAQPTP
jgi:heat shock protein HslJ